MSTREENAANYFQSLIEKDPPLTVDEIKNRLFPDECNNIEKQTLSPEVREVLQIIKSRYIVHKWVGFGSKYEYECEICVHSSAILEDLIHTEKCFVGKTIKLLEAGE